MTLSQIEVCLLAVFRSQQVLKIQIELVHTKLPEGQQSHIYWIVVHLHYLLWLMLKDDSDVILMAVQL